MYFYEEAKGPPSINMLFAETKYHVKVLSTDKVRDFQMLLSTFLHSTLKVLDYLTPRNQQRPTGLMNCKDLNGQIFFCAFVVFNQRNFINYTLLFMQHDSKITTSEEFSSVSK